MEEEKRTKDNRRRRLEQVDKQVTARDTITDVEKEILDETRGILLIGGEPRFLAKPLPAFSTSHRRELRDRFLQLKEIADIMSAEYGASFVGINVFGSSTRGYFLEGSDVDFSLIVNQVERKRAENMLARFQALMRERAIPYETRLTPFQDISTHLIREVLDPIGDPIDLPPEADEFFDFPGIPSPAQLFNRDYFNFFKGMFFGNRQVLRLEQRRILEAHTPEEWEVIRSDLAQAEQYVIIAFHRFGMRDIEDRERIRIIAGLHRVPPPYDDMRAVLSSDGGMSDEAGLLHNPWINTIILRRESEVGRQGLRQSLQSFLLRNHPLKNEIFEYVDSLSEDEILEELNELLTTVPSEENALAGVAFHNISDYLNRPLRLRELFLHPSQGTSDEGQVLTSLITPGAMDRETMDTLFGPTVKERSRLRSRVMIKAGYLLLKASQILSRREDLVLLQAKDIELVEASEGDAPSGELTHYLTTSEGIFREGRFRANAPRNLLAMADLMIPINTPAKRTSLENLSRLIDMLDDSHVLWREAFQIAENRLRIEEIERELARAQGAYPRVVEEEGRTLYYTERALDALRVMDKWVFDYGRPTEVAAIGVIREIRDREDELIEIVMPRMDRILTLDHLQDDKVLKPLMHSLANPESLQLSADENSLFIRVVHVGPEAREERIEIPRSHWSKTRLALLKLMPDGIPAEGYEQAQAQYLGRYGNLDTDWDVVAGQESVVTSQKYRDRALARARARNGKAVYSMHHHPRAEHLSSTVDSIAHFEKREAEYKMAVQLSAGDIHAEVEGITPLDWAEVRLLGTPREGLISEEQTTSRIYNVRDVRRWAIATRESIVELLGMQGDVAPEEIYLLVERLKRIVNNIWERGHRIDQFVLYALGKHDYKQLREIYSHDLSSKGIQILEGAPKDFLLWQLFAPTDSEVVTGLNAISLDLLKAQEQSDVFTLFSRVMLLRENEPGMRDRIEEELSQHGLTGTATETNVAKVLEAGVRLRELLASLDPDGSLADRYEEEAEDEFWEKLIAEEEATESL